MAEKLTRKLMLEYFRDKCIGAASCVAAHPERFFLKENKAVVKGAVSKGKDSFVLEGEFSDEEFGKILAAAEACPVNAYRLTDIAQDKVLVDTAVETTEEYREVKAEYDDNREFQLDPKGYFLIRVDREKKLIEVGFCGAKNKVEVKITGRTPIEIYQTIINKERLISRIDHAAYLGRELQKAYIALQKGIDYVQDDELRL